jgi:hypothetical protein
MEIVVRKSHGPNCKCKRADNQRLPAPPLVPLIRRALVDRYVTQPASFSDEYSKYQKEVWQKAGPKELAELYAWRFGGDVLTATRMFTRILAGQKWVHLDTADRICVFLGTGLEEIYGSYDPEGKDVA